MSKSGCIGGRKQQLDDMQSKDIIMFKDITVSRRHFEVEDCLCVYSTYSMYCIMHMCIYTFNLTFLLRNSLYFVQFQILNVLRVC